MRIIDDIKTDLMEICGECPFRVQSQPGQIAPWTLDTMLAALKHSTFPCLDTIPPDCESDEAFDRYDYSREDEMETCVGAALHLNAIQDLSMASPTAFVQGKLVGIGMPAKDVVFDTPYALRLHHTRPWTVEWQNWHWKKDGGFPPPGTYWQYFVTREEALNALPSVGATFVAETVGYTKRLEKCVEVHPVRRNALGLWIAEWMCRMPQENNDDE